jgi:enoyl-CoA hydratase/carnithine racemase
MAYQHILTEFKQGLATITFNRPPVNVLNIAMMVFAKDLRWFFGAREMLR